MYGVLGLHLDPATAFWTRGQSPESVRKITNISNQIADDIHATVSLSAR
jgi:hypothetical protein